MKALLAGLVVVLACSGCTIIMPSYKCNTTNVYPPAGTNQSWTVNQDTAGAKVADTVKLK